MRCIDKPIRRCASWKWSDVSTECNIPSFSFWITIEHALLTPAAARLSVVLWENYCRLGDLVDWAFNVYHCCYGLYFVNISNKRSAYKEIINFLLRLTPSTPAVPNCYCLKHPAPYWSNPLVLISDIRALWRSVLSARVPECQKLKLVG